MPTALQDVNTKIFTEWLPALKGMSWLLDIVWRCMMILPSIPMEHRMKDIILKSGFQ